MELLGFFKVGFFVFTLKEGNKKASKEKSNNGEGGRKGPDDLSSWKFLLGNILLSDCFLFSGFTFSFSISVSVFLLLLSLYQRAFLLIQFPLPPPPVVIHLVGWQKEGKEGRGEDEQTNQHNSG